MASRKQSRFERRSRSRQQRVQRRLDSVARGGAPRRRLSKPARAVLFAASLLGGLGLAQVVTATAVSWWSDDAVRLSAIAVQGTKRLSSDAVAKSLAAARDLDLDALRPEEIEAAVVAHPWIRAARVAVLPTGTVIVDVEEREPRAVLRVGAEADASDYFVDAEGFAFADVSERLRPEADRLPLVVAESRDDGDTLSDSLALLERLDALGLPGLARSDLPHRGLQLRLPRQGDDVGFVLSRSDGKTEVILGAGVDAVSARIERLERLLAAGLGELRTTASIDMRFAGQAVLRTEGASG